MHQLYSVIMRSAGMFWCVISPCDIPIHKKNGEQQSVGQGIQKIVWERLSDKLEDKNEFRASLVRLHLCQWMRWRVRQATE